MLIIGLDGVGYEAVIKYDLFPYLKTKGKVNSENIKIKTPPIWAAFLCGQKTNIKDFKDSGAGAGGIGNRKDELEVTPWVENYDTTIYNFPLYNYTNFFNGVLDFQLEKAKLYLDGKLSEENFIEKYKAEARYRLRNVDKPESELELYYVHNTDYICHITYMELGKKEPVTKYWKWISREIKRKLSLRNTAESVLVLSDHGSGIEAESVPRMGGHSRNGFFGFKKERDVPDVLDITEFESVISHIMG